MGNRNAFWDGSRRTQPWLLVALLLSCGCAEVGPVVYPAGGVVRLSDGTPMPGGWIEFQLADDVTARTAKAKIQSDGRFYLGTNTEADGAIPGPHRFLIVPPLPPFVNPDGQPPPAPDDPRYPKINPRYRSFESSGLEFNVTSAASQNQFEIRLKD